MDRERTGYYPTMEEATEEVEIARLYVERKGAMKLAEIASRIAAHLKRFEADPEINKPICGRDGKPYGDGSHRPFWMAHSWPAGNRVGIRYVSYQGETMMKKAEAQHYLAWLDAGNTGKHYAMEAAMKLPAQSGPAAPTTAPRNQESA